MVAGLRSLAKAMELPPAPTVRAPAPDPTLEGWAPAMAPGYSTLGITSCFKWVAADSFWRVAAKPAKPSQ
jgi:hypothetical protein